MSVELNLPSENEQVQEVENEIECILCKVKIKIQQVTNYNEHRCPMRSGDDKEVVICFAFS
jgi:hypothetical protein